MWDLNFGGEVGRGKWWFGRDSCGFVGVLDAVVSLGHGVGCRS